VQIGLPQVAVVLLEQLEVGTDDIGAGCELDILAVVGVAATVGQLLAHVCHVADHHTAPVPQSLLADVGFAPMQPSFDMVFKEVGGVLRFIAEHLHVIGTHRGVVEVVDHARGHDPHLMPLADVDKDVGLDLRHVAEEAVYVL